MRKPIELLLTSIACIGFTLNAVAGAEPSTSHEEKIQVSIITDDFELPETDLSHLAVGDAKTVVTETGKTIDLLRTSEGIEIYVDGQLVDAGIGDEKGLHKAHVIHERVELQCDSDAECDEMVWITDGDDAGIDSLHRDEPTARSSAASSRSRCEG